MENNLLSRERIEEVNNLTGQITDGLNKVILGQEGLIRAILIAILSRGHVLIEGVPGLGKTVLVRSLSDLLGLSFSRVQFTPDLMPADILGSHILQEIEGGKREMVFREGPVFTNIMLADEINRASPKTQSALLQAMQERCVSLMGETRELPKPFFVLATQNPIELEGTYPLPEAQLDRFLFKINVEMVDSDTLEQIISSRRRDEIPTSGIKIDADKLEKMFECMDGIALPRPVAAYIARLVSASHPSSAESPDLVGNYIVYGASPRAAIAIAEAARAEALLSGRPSVGFEDVRNVAVCAMNHRLILNYKARIEGITAASVMNKIMESVPEVQTGLPADVSVK